MDILMSKRLERHSGFWIYSKTCLKRTLKGPENFSAKGSFRLIKVHYIQYKKLNQDMHVLN